MMNDEATAAVVAETVDPKIPTEGNQTKSAAPVITEVSTAMDHAGNNEDAVSEEGQEEVNTTSSFTQVAVCFFTISCKS